MIEVFIAGMLGVATGACVIIVGLTLEKKLQRWLALRREARRLQREARYPYCRRGTPDCGDMICPCIDSAAWRFMFRQKVVEKLRRNGWTG